MKKLKSEIERIYSSKLSYFVFALSGLLSVVPFYFKNAYFVSFFAIIPCIYPILKYNYKGSKIFKLGFCRCYVFYFSLYFWFTKLYPLEFLGFTDFESLLVILCALIFIPLIQGIEFAFVFYLASKCKYLKFLAFPCIWILLEYFQSLGAFGFSWGKISISVSNFLPFIQSADLFGNYFISFLVVLINSLIAYSFINIKNRLQVFTCAFLIFTLNNAYGVFRINSYKNDESSITSAIIQGNADSNQKWSKDANTVLTEKYENLTYDAFIDAKSKNKKIDLVVFPETAIPINLNSNSDSLDLESKKVQEIYQTICTKLNTYLVTGAFFDKDNNYFNSAFLINPNGEISDPYSKRHLVPFGEYLPYREFFEKFMPILANMNAFSNDLTKGNSSVIFETKFGKVGSLICFDSIFEDLSRKSVLEGAEILTIITNDSWYKDSVALYQHNSQAIFRAVENKRQVLRAANTGLSTSISPTGQILQILPAQEEGYILSDTYFYNELTLYTRIGNIIIYVALIFILSCLDYKKILKIKFRKRVKK